MGWIDALRGIAIVLVILHHAIALSAMFSGVAPPTWLGAIDVLALPFRMPLLVFLSGFVLSRSLHKPIEQYYGGKVRAIVWPNIVWVLIYGLTVGLDQVSVWEAWVAGTWLWFLTYLAAYYALAPLLRRLPPWVAPLALWAGAFVVASPSWTQFLLLGAYFFAGYAVWVYRHRLQATAALPVQVACIAWAVGFAAYGFWSVRSPLVPVLSTTQEPLTGPAILAALAGVIFVARRLPDGWTRFVRYVGRNSLVFYVSHFPLQIVWTTVLGAASIWLWELHIGVGVLLGLAVGAALVWMRRWPPVAALFVMPASLSRLVRIPVR